MPGMRSRSIIHRQYLDHLQARFHSPVNQQFQIGKFTGAKGIPAAQTEHRYGYAGAAPGIIGQTDKTIMYYRQLVLARIAV